MVICKKGVRPLSCICALTIAACGGDDSMLRGGAPPGSTLEATLVDRDGDGELERGPGEPLVDRGGRIAPTTRVLGTLVQITDAHVVDEESPGRVPFLDRLGSPFNSTFRPQEALSAHVLDAAVRAANRLRPDAVLLTGDLIDSAQANELALATRVLGGGRADPDSGRPGYDGVQDRDNPDPFYFRPDVDAPAHPGLLERAQRPFQAQGVRAPWYPVAGNHDLLVQGELAATPATSAAATGTRAVTAPTDETLALDPAGQTLSAERIDALLAAGLPGRERTVAPDPERRELSPADAVAGLRAASRSVPPTTPAGRLEYGVDAGPHLRVIVLDVVRRDRGAEGRVAPESLKFLQAELARRHERAIVVVSHQPLAGAEGAEPALAALEADPRVVALVAGHRHRAEVTRRGRLWQVETPSLADFPQQARAIRLVETAGGGRALELFMLDHEGRGDDLAGISRALSFLDVQGGRPGGFRGRKDDRNVRLALR